MQFTKPEWDWMEQQLQITTTKGQVLNLWKPIYIG